MENNPVTEDAIKINDDEDIFEDIHKITETVTESSRKQAIDESIIFYVKKEIHKLEEATKHIIEKRKKMEEENRLRQNEESDLRRITETLTSSLETKQQFLRTLKEQNETKQNEIDALQNKCTTTLMGFQKQYEDIRQTYRDKHPLYLELKNAQTSSLKAEIEVKLLKKKLTDLKKKYKLRTTINQALFNKSIIQFVQAIVDYRKLEAQNDGNLPNTSKVCNYRDIIETNMSFNIETISSNLKPLPDNITNVSSATKHNYDEIEARGEQTLEEWKQYPVPFSSNKRRAISVDNTTLAALPKNISANKMDFQTNVSSIENNTVSINQIPKNDEKHTLTSYKQLKRKPSTKTKSVSQNKKIEVIDVQTFIVSKEQEQDTIAMFSNNKNKNEFMYPSIQLTELQEAKKNVAEVSSFKRQRTDLPCVNTNQDNYNFQMPVDNMSKPDLTVSPFFEKPKTTEFKTIPTSENFSVPALIGSYNTSDSDIQSSPTYSNEEFMNLMSPMNTIDAETNVNNECNSAQPPYSFNFGQTSADQLNTSQINTLFGTATSNFFNMF